MSELAILARLRGWDDASRNLRHFLGASGRTIGADIRGMLAEIPGFAGASRLQYQIGIVGGARNWIQQNYKGGIVTFNVTTPWQLSLGAEGGNWHLALGGFQFAHTARVTAVPSGNGGITVRIDPTLHVFDRYDWNPNGVAFSEPVRLFGRTIIPRQRFNDNDMRSLHQTGLGRDFEIRASRPLNYQVVRFPPSVTAVPEFGARGGGTQYLTGKSVEQLVREGFLKKIGP